MKLQADKAMQLKRAIQFKFLFIGDRVTINILRYAVKCQ